MVRLFIQILSLSEAVAKHRLSATLRRLNTPLSFMKHLRSAVQAPVHGRNHLPEIDMIVKLKLNYPAEPIPVPPVMQMAIGHQNNIRSSYHNQFVADVAGSESVDIQATQVVEQVYTEIDGPDDGTPLPSANFRDLTLIGIKGGTSALRPTLGPDYFLQLHCFSRDGIQVRQRIAGLGPGLV